MANEHDLLEWVHEHHQRLYEISTRLGTSWG